MDTTNRVIIPGRRMWFQTTILFLCALTGLGFFAGWVPNPDALKNVSPWVLPVWYGLLATGGVLGLAGSFWRWNPYRGLLAERAAMLMLVFGFLLYAVGTVGHQGVHGIVQAALILLWAVPSIARGLQLTQDMAALRYMSSLPLRPASAAGSDVTLTTSGDVEMHTVEGVEMNTPDGVRIKTGEGVELKTSGSVEVTTSGDFRVAGPEPGGRE